MLVEGDVQCLHCGFEGGVWRGTKGTQPTWEGFRASSGVAAPDADVSGNLYCLRCGGPVMVTNVSAVLNAQRLRRIQRLREELAALRARAERRAKRRAA